MKIHPFNSRIPKKLLWLSIACLAVSLIVGALIIKNNPLIALVIGVSETPAADTGLPTIPPSTGSLWIPTPGTTWDWQLDTPVKMTNSGQVYDIDLFDNDSSLVDELHFQGRHVICYISVGTMEDWRPDSDQFHSQVIGNPYEGWSGEYWLDIRRIDLLAPIMQARLELCQSKGFA